MDAKTLKALAKADKTLAKIIKQVGPCTILPKRGRNPYESLVESIAYQQLTGKAAATIFSRVRALYPKNKFPKPEEILKTKDEDLRGAGLSFAKVMAIKDIAQKTIDGLVPSSREIVKLSDEEIIERLVQIRGVGRWTVEMLLIFHLARPDIWPVTDYGVRKGVALLYNKKELPTPKELLAFGERWKPYRTTASWYLWRAIELPKKKPNP
jgi:DNA-3-methyladenine glycosylase II